MEKKLAADTTATTTATTTTTTAAAAASAAAVAAATTITTTTTTTTSNTAITTATKQSHSHPLFQTRFSPTRAGKWRESANSVLAKVTSPFSSLVFVINQVPTTMLTASLQSF